MKNTLYIVLYCFLFVAGLAAFVLLLNEKYDGSLEKIFRIMGLVLSNILMFFSVSKIKSRYNEVKKG